MAFNTSLDLTFKSEVAWRFANTLDLGSTLDTGQKIYDEPFTNGTGSNNANELWHDVRRITLASTTDDIDLSGSLTNAFGRSVRFTHIKGLRVKNLGTPSGSTYVETDGEDILVGGAAAGGNAWGTLFNANQDAEITVRAGGEFILTAPLTGLAITASTGDILRVLHDGSAGDIDYAIWIWGLRET